MPKTSVNSPPQIKVDGSPGQIKDLPIFTVAVATYQRGAKLQPTLHSIAAQTFSAFEVLVVSDGPASPGLKAVVERFDERFRLLELPTRTRSQSGPNNLAWQQGRGKYLAYLGHDDIWHPDHLSALAHVFATHPTATFAVSGTIMIGPAGARDEFTWVSGMFAPTTPDPALQHFFPPSSIAHLRRTETPLSRWPEPLTSQGPVDSTFELRAAQDGFHFFSTQRVTVFKFNSALRYLSYLQPEDYEQQEMLHMCSTPEALQHFVAEKIALAKRQGTYMFLAHPDAHALKPGEIVRTYEKIRGIDVDTVQQIHEPLFFKITDEPRGFDWHELEGNPPHSWRWSGPSPRPRIALPFSASVPVTVIIHISHFVTTQIRDSLQVFCAGKLQHATLSFDDSSGKYHVTFNAELSSDKPTVLELRMTGTATPTELDGNSSDARQLGLCLTGISLIPNAPENLLSAFWRNIQNQTKRKVRKVHQ